MKKLKIGVAGLGRAFALMVTAFRDPRIALVAATDPRAEARRQFERDFSAATFSTIEELCRADIDAVYIASPHQFHAGQSVTACNAGKHVLVEKPMAISLADCERMTKAATRSKVQLVVGHSHSFDGPILQARKLIAGGRYGKLKMITALNYTDYLYRPRRPEELDTKKGGGAVFNQAAHQVDIVRLLAGAQVKSVRAMTGAWDRKRPTEGAYSALITFEKNIFAQLIYSGYGHFDSDEFMGWVGEMGLPKNSSPRKKYGDPAFTPPEFKHHQHFGLVIASCEKADLRPLPDGVMIYAGGGQRFEPLPPPRLPRAEVIDELYGAVFSKRPPLHDGRWGTATLEACLAILRSAREGKEIRLGSRR